MWCFNRNVLIGLGVVALGVLAIRPEAIGAALPVLVLLACPLSMVFMMRGMNRAAAEPEPAGTTDAPGTDAEIVGLRAEVDQLRAELSDKHDSRLAE
jgi:Protein of unknown function (DUF2933)